MPSSVNGGSWLSGDTIGKAAMNLKTNLNISFATYTPTVGADTVAGQLVIDSNGCVLYVVNAANNAYGLAFNQSLRTTDSPTFTDATINSTLISTHLGQDVRSTASPTFAALTISNSGSITFGTGGSVVFGDATAVIGSSSHYVATLYVNTVQAEGASPTLTGFTFGSTTFTGIVTIQLAQAELIMNSTTSGNQAYIELENATSGYVGYLGIVATAGQLSTSSVVGDVVIRSNSAGILFAASTTQTMYIASNGNVSIAGNITMGSTLKMASSNFGLFSNGSVIYLANIGSNNGFSVDGSGNCASAGNLKIQGYFDVTNQGTSSTIAGNWVPTASNSYSLGSGSEIWAGMIAYNYYLISVPAVTSAHSLVIASNGQIGYVSSSGKYKENIRELTDCSWIYDLHPVLFDYKDVGQTGYEKKFGVTGKQSPKNVIGLIAEEVLKVRPEMVYSVNKDPDSVYYEHLPMATIVELKKLRDRVDQLEKVLQAEGILVNKP